MIKSKSYTRAQEEAKITERQLFYLLSLVSDLRRTVFWLLFAQTHPVK
ncbi:hypothetical protein BI040_gp61 [Escherichia phage vB_EcoS_NBD2]|uniref:Uncharacterized protein n=1 Tax=Escherichia phage vB_EcoS_NBD2 TaxID=1852563 RepID=A0A192Y8F7_9CAUD|nr:hypothetical protein BI040_gp61 [Escherichia phage vB_EcoS_NBD2]ANM45893.1 hypothetical protein NBD2_51 [Escherichia phage vB_EcoS_NBD2]